MQDRAIQEELDSMAHSPDRTRRYVEYKKAETAFHLWDLDANGKVIREEITQGLLKCASAQCHECRTFQSQGFITALAFLRQAKCSGDVQVVSQH